MAFGNALASINQPGGLSGIEEMFRQAGVAPGIPMGGRQGASDTVSVDGAVFDRATGQPMFESPTGQPRSGGGGIFDILGQLSDIVSTSRGAPQTYATAEQQKRARQQQEQFQQSLAQWMQNPDDPAAFVGMAVSPEHAEHAMKLATSRAAMKDKQLGVTDRLDTTAMRLLGSVRDQQGYDRARQILGSLYGKHGLDVSQLGLPDQFSPELLEEIRMRGTDPWRQMGADRAERRLGWDIEDDEIDNSRLMQNTESMMADREARLAEMRRHHDMTSADRRRGHDITSADRRRGQDTPRPGRASRASPAPRGQARRTATDAQGNTVEWNGKEWVPVK